MGLSLLHTDFGLYADPEPLPLDMSDTQILDWLAEYCDQAVYNRPTRQQRGGFTLFCDETTTRGETLREAVTKAAAKFAAENADH